MVSMLDLEVENRGKETLGNIKDKFFRGKTGKTIAFITLGLALHAGAETMTDVSKGDFYEASASGTFGLTEGLIGGFIVRKRLETQLEDSSLEYLGLFIDLPEGIGVSLDNQPKKLIPFTRSAQQSVI